MKHTDLLTFKNLPTLQASIIVLFKLTVVLKQFYLFVKNLFDLPPSLFYRQSAVRFLSVAIYTGERVIKTSVQSLMAFAAAGRMSYYNVVFVNNFHNSEIAATIHSRNFL